MYIHICVNINIYIYIHIIHILAFELVLESPLRLPGTEVLQKLTMEREATWLEKLHRPIRCIGQRILTVTLW